MNCGPLAAPVPDCCQSTCGTGGAVVVVGAVVVGVGAVVEVGVLVVVGVVIVVLLSAVRWLFDPAVAAMIMIMRATMAAGISSNRRP